MTDPVRRHSPSVGLPPVVNDSIIMTMETVGLVFVTLGCGLFASWIAGSAGFFFVSGACFLVAAYLANRNQYRHRAELTSPSAQPMTRNAEDLAHPPSLPDTVMTRVKKVFVP